MDRSDYQWTRGRLVGGAVILLAGAAVVAALAVREISRLPPSNEEFLRALAAYEAWMEEQEGELPRAGPPAIPFDVSDLRVPPQAIVRGGPPKDGIPSLTEPRTVPVREAGFLDDSVRVVGVRVGGEARAYPVPLLIHHEAVNDVLGGAPIAVVYCPLCDSASVVERRLDGRTYEFGVSGRLVNSNVLLHDRTDHALWSQVGFTAISGPNAGRALPHLPWTVTTLARWRAAHPGSSVVSYETGHGRDYDRHPYGDYFLSEELYFPVRRDGRLPVKERVVGVKAGDVTRAYPLAAVAAAPGGTVRDVLGGAAVVLRAAGPGSVRVIEAPAEARSVHTFWFAWAAFHPETDIYRSKPE